MIRPAAVPLILVLFILAVALPPPQSFAQQPADVARALRRYVVRVSASGTRGGGGTGFVLREIQGRVIIATFAGNVPPASDVVVVDVLGNAYRGRVEYRSVQVGIALVGVASWAGPRIVDLDTTPVRSREQMVVLGIDPKQGQLAHVLVEAAGPRRLAQPVPTSFRGGPIVSLQDQRVRGLLSSPRGDMIPSLAILAALSALSPPPLVAPPPPPRPTPSRFVTTPSPPPAPVETRILAFPAGAAISLDGREVGAAPVTLSASRLPPGRHRLTARASGRLTVSRQVTAGPGTSTILLVLPRAIAALPSNPDHRALLSRVIQALERGDASTAADAARALVDAAPGLAEGRIYLGTTLWLQGELGEALTTVRSHIRVYGETERSLDAYVLMGILFEEQGQVQLALTRYKLALKVQPRFSSWLALAVESTDRSIAVMEQQLARDPGDVRTWIALGLAYEAKGRFAEGMRAFREVLFTSPPPVVPTSAPPAIGLSPSPTPAAPAGVTLSTFPTQASVSVGERIAGKTPLMLPRSDAPLRLRITLVGHIDVTRTLTFRERGDVYLILLPLPEREARTRLSRQLVDEGLAAFGSGNWAVASRSLSKALEVDVVLFHLHVYIAAAMREQDRSDEALDHLRKYLNARNTGPLALRAYALMGLVWELKGRHRDALTTYKLALRLHPALASVINELPATTDAEIVELEREVQASPGPQLLFRLAGC